MIYREFGKNTSISSSSLSLQFLKLSISLHIKDLFYQMHIFWCCFANLGLEAPFSFSFGSSSVFYSLTTFLAGWILSLLFQPWQVLLNKKIR